MLTSPGNTECEWCARPVENVAYCTYECFARYTNHVADQKAREAQARGDGEAW